MGHVSHVEYNDVIEALRPGEYPMLQDGIYLDHAGTTLYSKSLMEAFTADMLSNLYGNPHSGSVPSERSLDCVEDTRLRLLDFFGADPRHYDLVFVANATAGAKLVADSLRCLPGGFIYAYHEACHTSLIGVREEATLNFCVNDNGMESFANGKSPLESLFSESDTMLWSYSAQSHFDGTRYPLSWGADIRAKWPSGNSGRLYTLLDASSLCVTSALDLSDAAAGPDFVIASLYKMFGFPDLGILLVRREAETAFNNRRYFGGGTVDMVVTGRKQWHASKSGPLHGRLEDGTLPFHNVIAVKHCLNTHERLFGSAAQVKSHVAFLRSYLDEELRQMRHGNGDLVCQIYGETRSRWSLGIGPILSFNIRGSRGSWVRLEEFDKLVNVHKIFVRTGSTCSPGSVAAALDLRPWELSRNLSAGFRCGANGETPTSKPAGVIRVSLGPMSTLSDVENFLTFMREFFVDARPRDDRHAEADQLKIITNPLRVKSLSIFPIKSCGSFKIPEHVTWHVQTEGLAWDREWCLIHSGTSQALSQKRFPAMALLQPTLDLEQGILRVEYRGGGAKTLKPSITIPLSHDPNLFTDEAQQRPSTVCGDIVAVRCYASQAINSFFSSALGVQCVLARFPPGGTGAKVRTAKVVPQGHQLSGTNMSPSRSPSCVPTPPESDSDQPPHTSNRILLSNESPILIIQSSSVEKLNEDIRHRDGGGGPVDEASFRANIVLEPSLPSGNVMPFDEDRWNALLIGRQGFRILGGCRRCQMVCIDQETGEKRHEPLATLAKTRRFDGRIFFGVHATLDPTVSEQRSHDLRQIRVGDLVTIDP